MYMYVLRYTFILRIIYFVLFLNTIFIQFSKMTDYNENIFHLFNLIIKKKNVKEKEKTSLNNQLNKTKYLLFVFSFKVKKKKLRK